MPGEHRLDRKILEELESIIGEGVRKFDNLPPFMGVVENSGELTIVSVDFLFTSPKAKELVVPFVEHFFKEEESVAVLVIVAEAWTAKEKIEKGSGTKSRKGAGRSLEYHPEMVEKVMAAIYSRDREDRIILLDILEGRKGVKFSDNMSPSSPLSTGRMIRKDPCRN